MNHVLTVGDIFWPSVVVIGIVVIIGVIAIVLSIFADAWKH